MSKVRLSTSETLSSYGGGDVKCATQRNISDQDPPNVKFQYPTIPFLQLYRYATLGDKINLVVASILCTITAVFNSIISITFGDITGAIVDYVTIIENGTTPQQQENEDKKLNDALMFFVLTSVAMGIATAILTYLSTVMFNYSSLRQTHKIRELFLVSVLNQDIAWYDVNQTGDFASRVSDDLAKIEDGIGEKVATFIFYEMTFVTSILQALIRGWELALVCMVSFPIATVAMGFVAWISSRLSKGEMEAYGEAGSIAEEILTSIRTVVAFEGQDIEEKRYNDHLRKAKNNNIRRSLFSGISNGLMWFFSFASYSVAFWYGVKLILRERDLEDPTYDAGNMIAIFFSVLTGTWYFGIASPFIEIFGIAKGAASKIFAVIENEPIINASKNNGEKLDKLEGNIVFKDVFFHYPSRPDVKILQGMSLKINSGETVALVGSSGCGKSTCIQLIQRYYDPLYGSVLIDDQDIRNLDLTWLRSKIGVVGQEPVLFEATIAENIKFGCDHATQEDVEKAAKKANAHTFIQTLPLGYNTMIGERGAQLSGGQKQRIAIARALVREPSILLLDEATSALDTSSEAIVQAALDAASNECTTIIVAHRLSTIRNADRIVVVSEGKILEEGTHQDLIAKKGAYYQLVTTRTVPEDDGEDDDDDDEDAPLDPNMNHNANNATNHTNQKMAIMRQQSVDSYNEMVATKDLPLELEDKKLSTFSSLGAIMKINKPEWWVLMIGFISAAVTGCGIPISAIMFGDVLKVLSYDDNEQIRSETNLLSIYFLIIGLGVGFGNFFQIYMFGIAGEKLSMRLRSKMFETILAQEIAWFDDSDNGVGSLCARLSGEAASVQGATGLRIGTMLNAISTVLIALGISLYFEWRVALVGACFVPMIIFGAFMEEKITSRESAGDHKSLMRSTKIAVEAIGNIRTVASLNCENKFHDMYMAELIPFQNIAKKNTHVRGIVFGFSRSLVFFAYATSLYYGTQLIIADKTDYNNVFIVSEALITSSWAIANALAFAPNFQKGVVSATRIIQLLNRKPRIQDGSDEAHETSVTGNINYNKIYFSYPTRPTVKVLRGLNLNVLQGKMVALVGPSGCGKSTIIQLLERFYDPLSGTISVDGKDTKSMSLSALRSHLGIVSQEPNLFSRTIAENIAYGDNKRHVTKEEIIEAARNANIHNFINSLPLGYETKLGEKGTQLSGGQKQRVAIARALIRNPKVLLLDEATSALDAESEKVVQDALDKAKVGRTCISIAHRLTTIQDADVICVINHGRVAEMGTHHELLKLQGIYYNLCLLQNGLT